MKFVNLSDELPWRFLRRILHVLIHDKWHWHWQRAATLTLYNQENDKYSHLEQNITSFVVEIAIGMAQTKSSCPDLMQFWFSFFSFFFLNNSISSSIFKLPIRSEIYNIVHSKSQIKFPLLPFIYLFLVTLFWFLTKIKPLSTFKLFNVQYVMISSFLSFIIFQVVVVFVSLLFYYKFFCNYFFLFFFQTVTISEVIHIVWWWFYWCCRCCWSW